MERGDAGGAQRLSGLSQRSALSRKPSFKPMDMKRGSEMNMSGRLSRSSSTSRPPARSNSAYGRGSLMRKEEIFKKEMELEKLRLRKMEEAELREACGELRKVAALMAAAKPFELGKTTLSEWAQQMNTQVLAIEESIAKLVPLPTPPDNTIRPAAVTRADADRPSAQARTATMYNLNLAGTGGGLKSTAPLHESQAKVTVTNSVSSAMYLAAEAVTDAVRAERCVVYQHVPRSDELQGICVVNGCDTQPSNIRTPANAGWPGQAYATGIMANVSNAYSDASKHDAQLDKRMGYRVRSTLCVPIPGKVGGKPFGVIQLMNKNRGTAPFGPEDEDIVAAAAPILSYILTTYPADTVHHHFDPSALHKACAFKPQPPQNLALPQLPMSRWFVYRSNQSGHMRKKAVIKENEAAVAGARQNILEVDSHIRSLEDAWMKSVTLNIEFEREKSETITTIKGLRDCIKQKKRTIRDLSSRLDGESSSPPNASLVPTPPLETPPPAAGHPPARPRLRIPDANNAPKSPKSPRSPRAARVGGAASPPAPAPVAAPSLERIHQLLDEIKDL
eukprot:TRINITY_DN2325_c0_g2_i1.p1 TRINITY_DN2325_c0_g2~~TRINITY_DN2325_c0_g2_i1.p1  ORF type:complete len:588 (+),score=178.20 TRINITY_DN2325_c0_g2_i1:80-1765(+)